MIKTWFFLVILCIGCILSMSFWPEESDDLPNMPKEVEFSYHIQPILSKNCYSCHGNDPSSRKAGLRLDIEKSAKSALESGNTAIVNKSVRRSEMIHRIQSNDPDIQMPPPEAKKELTEREIALLNKWIKQGAKWDDHWAFTKPIISKDLSLDQGQTIDHYISVAQKSKQLKSVAEANKNELIRRVSYVLTGLPPSLEELSTFLGTENNDGYEKMIDHYLGSKHFGERWARHWLDLMRYGESMGHEGDFNISNAYEYRDYVIRAFNHNVPYDLFIKEHLAGDMLEEPRMHPDQGFNESQIGTSYFFLGEGKHAPVDIKLEESEKIDNMIDVTSKTFTALTVACAKCHDHKFDAIPTTDYYSMYGMIESSRLIPKAARRLVNETELITELSELKTEIKDDIIEFVNNQKEESEPTREVVTSEELSQDTLSKVLADFRHENWNGWYSDGIAFGENPVNGGVDVYSANDEYKSFADFEEKRLRSVLKEKKNSQNNGLTEKENLENIEVNLLSGFASSRTISRGLQGVLHGPNFTNEFDTIAVRARGKNGTLRIVVDNFQVFQGPLWDRCEIVINDDEWKTYKLSAQLAKGNKAYLEFFPGRFEHHMFGIKPDDYVDIQWAVGYSGLDPIGDKELEIKQATTRDNSNSSITLRQTDIKNVEDKLNRIDELQEILYDPTHFIGMVEGDAIKSPVFNRGSIKDLSEEKVPHEFLSAVHVPVEFPNTGSGRLAWAKSLVHPDNPLTARVMVNRIWHHLFGKGIVETVDNFGIQGQIPSHPELLDYLAVSFVENNWSIKSLIKEIMMSESFKQSSKINEANLSVDPNNIYLHAYPIRRLESEAIRDGILAVTGCLDSEMYGPSVPVYLSEFMTGRGRPNVSGPIDSYGRRSIYQAIRRNFIPEMMITFDMPIPFTSFGKRNVTNVPAQSLTLLNDSFVHEQANYWAQDLIQTTTNTSERLHEIYAAAFSRFPSEFEEKQAVEFLEKLAQTKNSTLEIELNNTELWAAYCHSIINAKEFIHLL